MACEIDATHTHTHTHTHTDVKHTHTKKESISLFAEYKPLLVEYKSFWYGVAWMSMLLKIIGLSCKRAL